MRFGTGTSGRPINSKGLTKLLDELHEMLDHKLDERMVAPCLVTRSIQQ